MEELTGPVALLLMTTFETLGRVIAGVVGALFARMCLLWMDRNAGFMQTVEGWPPEAQALYRGLRFIAVCLLVGLSISR